MGDFAKFVASHVRDETVDQLIAENEKLRQEIVRMKSVQITARGGSPVLAQGELFKGDLPVEWTLVGVEKATKITVGQLWHGEIHFQGEHLRFPKVLRLNYSDGRLEVLKEIVSKYEGGAWLVGSIHAEQHRYDAFVEANPQLTMYEQLSRFAGEAVVESLTVTMPCAGPIKVKFVASFPALMDEE